MSDRERSDLSEDVEELRVRLAGCAEAAVVAAGHHHDWCVLGVPDHMPVEVALVRLEATSEALWVLALAALDARLAVACVRARVYGRRAGELVG